MGFTKISSGELNSRGATTLANQPEISAQELKQEFDAPAKEVVAPKFNNLIDELESTSAAASLGAVAPTGFTGATVQAVLNGLGSAIKTMDASDVGVTPPPGQTGDDVQTTINNIYADLADLNSKKHTHSNKTVIDKFSEVSGQPYYDGSPIGGGVVDSSLSTTSENPVQNKVITNTLNSMGTPEAVATAVSEAHTHSNKSLLDSYTQTNSDIADAVSKKHSHSNMTTLDKFSEDGSGNPTFNGNTLVVESSGGNVRPIIISDTDLTPGTSALTTGTVYLCYE